MTQLLQNITSWFKTNAYSDLEAFINSKHPTNAAEVDYWTREYHLNQQKTTELWGRGL